MRASQMGLIRNLLISLLLIALISCKQKTTETSVPEKEHPNIILFMADDLGYGEVACYGKPVVKTPHLDQIMQRGWDPGKITSYLT